MHGNLLSSPHIPVYLFLYAFLYGVTPTGQYLISGGQDGVVKVYDAHRGIEISTATAEAMEAGDADAEGSGGSGGGETLAHGYSFLAARDAINGVSVHPYLALLATSSGQRQFAPPIDDSSDDSADEEEEEVLEEAAVSDPAATAVGSSSGGAGGSAGAVSGKRKMGGGGRAGKKQLKQTKQQQSAPLPQSSVKIWQPSYPKPQPT
jgi:hypothetical protein